MLSLAAFRYRNVLASQGGPVAGIEMGTLPVRGRKMILANASLRPGLTHRTPASLFSATADGTGVHVQPVIARHMAVSEALERWAYSELVKSEHAADYGFDVDPSTCGMAAYPGILARDARRRAVLEAIERFSLIGWWEGMIEGHRVDTDWPGISAVAIESPLGGVTVVVYGQTGFGLHAYGHAADTSLTGAIERAITELARHEWVLRRWWLDRLAGIENTPASLLERRALFFATPEGFEVFNARVHASAHRPAPRPEVICDCEIPGPWSDYASVWRYCLRPASDGYYRSGERYFFL